MPNHNNGLERYYSLVLMIFLKAIRTIITFMDIYICINNQNDYSDGKSQPFFSSAKSCCYKYNIACIYICIFIYI